MIGNRISAALAVLTLLLPVAASAQDKGDPTDKRIERILRDTPLVDGHNDLPWEIREAYDFWRKPLDLRRNTSALPAPLQTDLPRLRRGRVGAQFWVAWVPSTQTGPEAVEMTLEQIDIIHRMTARYPDALEMAGTAADIRRIHKTGRIASLIGVEGGHQIGNNLAVLRQYYALGTRYMTLTHSDGNDWADSATAAPVHKGLTAFGRDVVREMNRIGMMIDLSHVSAAVMKEVLAVSRAPIIFSHSNARAITDHPRNVPDEILRLMPRNGGVVMVNFFCGFISNDYNRWEANREGELARTAAFYTGQPEQAKAAMAEWDAAHKAPVVTIAQVADHIEHIRDVAGADHVGIGSDFDGILGTSIQGLEGVDTYPALFRELIRRGWKDGDLAKLAGGNLLRTMEGVERVSASLSREAPLLTSVVKPTK